jgi:hypothetical protein
MPIQACSIFSVNHFLRKYMMIPRLQKISALLSFAFLAFVISSCAQPTGPAATGSKSFGANPPSWSSSTFNIATPTLNGSQTAAGEVTLTWSNGGTTGGETAGGEFYPGNGYTGTLTTGSGHTAVFMWDGSAWVKVSEETDGNYVATGLADGTYSFYVQEKSKEGTGQNTETYHSAPSSVVEVVVQSCVNKYSVGSAEQPGWNAQQGTGINPQGNLYKIIMKKVTNGNPPASLSTNFHFILAASCPGYSIAGHTVTADVVAETGHGYMTATEDINIPGKYMFNGNSGIWVANTVGVYNLTIKVDGVEIDPPGTWQVEVIN